MKPFYYYKDKPKHLVVSETVFTFVGWIIFGYILMWIGTVLLWGGAGFIIYGNVAESPYYFLGQVFLYGLLAYVLLGFWYLYNYVRYGINEKRTRISDITEEGLADVFQLPMVNYRDIKSAKYMSVTYRGFYSYKT